jgi:DNA-binding NarL/FixJ family response regulator
MAMRVLIIVSMRLFREGLAETLSRRDDIEVVDARADLGGVQTWIAGTRANVALIEAALPGFMSLPRLLAGLADPVPVVAIGAFDDDDQVVACAEAGVGGYVSREESVEDLVMTLASARCREVACSPRIAAALVRRVATLGAVNEPRDRGAQLTKRELDVVALIDQGLSNKQIAQRLVVELSTVKNHVHNVLEKLQVEGRADAVSVLHARGTLPPSRPAA